MQYSCANLNMKVYNVASAFYSNFTYDITLTFLILI